MSNLLSPIRADGHPSQGTDPTEERDPLKAAIWRAIQPFAGELERSGGVTFMGLRNAVAKAVQFVWTHAAAAPHPTVRPVAVTAEAKAIARAFEAGYEQGACWFTGDPSGEELTFAASDAFRRLAPKLLADAPADPAILALFSEPAASAPMRHADAGEPDGGWLSEPEWKRQREVYVLLAFQHHPVRVGFWNGKFWTTVGPCGETGDWPTHVRPLPRPPVPAPAADTTEQEA